jgi:hypothetical protein
MAAGLIVRFQQLGRLSSPNAFLQTLASEQFLVSLRAPEARLEFPFGKHQDGRSHSENRTIGTKQKRRTILVLRFC